MLGLCHEHPILNSHCKLFLAPLQLGLRSIYSILFYIFLHFYICRFSQGSILGLYKQGLDLIRDFTTSTRHSTPGGEGQYTEGWLPLPWRSLRRRVSLLLVPVTETPKFISPPSLFPHGLVFQESFPCMFATALLIRKWEGA